MELSSADKAEDRIVWYNVMWCQITRHCNKWQSEYLKKGTSSKTGINWTRYFMEKLPKIGHD